MHRGVQSGLPRPLPRKGEEARVEEKPQFRVEYVTPSAEVGIVVLEGEIDIYSAPQF